MIFGHNRSILVCVSMSNWSRFLRLWFFFINFRYIPQILLKSLVIFFPEVGNWNPFFLKLNQLICNKRSVLHIHCFTLRATSHTRLRARDQVTSSILIGGKGRAGCESQTPTLSVVVRVGVYNSH